MYAGMSCSHLKHCYAHESSNPKYKNACKHSLQTCKNAFMHPENRILNSRVYLNMHESGNKAKTGNFNIF